MLQVRYGLTDGPRLEGWIAPFFSTVALAIGSVDLANSAVKSRRFGTIMTRKRKLTKVAIMGTAVASAVFVLAVGASSFATTSKTTAAHVTKMVKIPGGTMTIAEAPAAGPNYIFPMMGGAYFSVTNFELHLHDVQAALLVRRR